MFHKTTWLRRRRIIVEMGFTAAARRPTMLYWTSPTRDDCARGKQEFRFDRTSGCGIRAPYASNDIVGRNLFRFIDGMEVRQLYQALSKKVLENRRSHNVFLPLRRSGGSSGNEHAACLG